MVKATSILHKALTMNARPTHHLELALRKLKAGEKWLFPTTEVEEEEDEEEQNPSGTVWSCLLLCGGHEMIIYIRIISIILLINLQQWLQKAHPFLVKTMNSVLLLVCLWADWLNSPSLPPWTLPLSGNCLIWAAGMSLHRCNMLNLFIFFP